MSIRTVAIVPEYLPATRIHREFRIGPTALLWMVVQGFVRTMTVKGALYPLYNVDDVRQHYTSRPRKHAPDALTGKCRGKRKAVEA